MRRIMITEKEYAFLIEGIIVQHNLQRYRKAERQVAMLKLPNEIAKREFKEYCEDRNEPNWVKPFINMLIAGNLDFLLSSQPRFRIQLCRFAAELELEDVVLTYAT